MNRRRFLYAAAAGAALFSRMPDLRAAGYDLIVRGGRVIDPSLGIDGVRDVAVAGGRIAAVQENIGADAAEIIDARGKLVVPGLIDIHCHAAAAKDGPSLVLRDGVTSYNDAGSYGADGIDQAAAVVKRGPNFGRLLVNISRIGIDIQQGELHDLSLADVDLARAAISRNRDVVVGVKVRLSNNVTGANDLEALRRAQEAASSFGLPVMVHIGQSYSPLPAILSLLKRGDMITHVYAPAPNGILDDSGRILPEVLAARRRGILFDFGNGTLAHFNWDVFERAVKQGFVADTISTDWVGAQSRTTNVVDLPNVMSKFLMFGLPLIDVIAHVTVNSARAIHAFSDRGTLNVGAPADIAVLDLREGSFQFMDNYNGIRTGRQRLFPIATVIGGKKAPDRA
ncbi:amidohydrolase/deacetylase family metallohydrolase [Bradyrhizobium centrolobii]|nr:amidohydrolase/deacetylase family metallohydrolase [Bradyrhizobium centrolobii]